MAASSESVSADETSQASSLQMQKLTQDDIFCRIVPALGSISYGYFSIHIMNDSWFKNVFHQRDVVVANSFWFNAHIGVGLYLFTSQHLRKAPVNRRILYSVFGSFLFNFGSVLFWATCKSLLPESPGLKTLFGLVSGFVLLYVGKEYVEYIDSQKHGSVADKGL